MEPDSRYELLGTIIGLAMYNHKADKQLFLDVPLAPAIFKILLGGKPNLDDLAVW